MKPIRYYLHNHKPPNLLLLVTSVSKIIHFWNYIIFQRSWRVRRILDTVLSNLKEGDHVLDAGCGDGQHLLYIAKRFAWLNIHGIDIAKGNIELLNSYISNHKLNNVFINYGDLLTTNPADQYSLVYCISTLYMIDDDEGLLRLWYKNTESDGRIILYQPINQKIEIRLYANLRKSLRTYEKDNKINKIYTYDDLKYLFNKTGWTIEYQEFGMGKYGRIGYEIYSYFLLQMSNTSNYLLFIFWLILIFITAPISIIFQIIDYESTNKENDNAALIILKKD